MFRAMNRVLAVATAVVGLAMATSSANALTANALLTPFTGDPVQVAVTLDDLGGSGTIRFTLQSTPGSDITGFYFNISDTSLLSGLFVTNADFLVTATDFSGSVSAVGGAYNNMNGGGTPAPFHGGIAIGTQGAGAGDFFPNPSFVLQHSSENLTIDHFMGQILGARVQSIGGSGGPSAKLAGEVIPEPMTAMLTLFSAGAVAVAVRRRRAA